jgi:hypothetical protein
MEGESDFLVRVGASPKGKLSERLSDGSVVLVVRGHDEQGQVCEILMRQICGQVSKSGRGRRTVRLWTSLLDEKAYPAEELLALYARRWEQEIMYQKCKVHISGGELLSSYTEQTAMQEMAALVMGQAPVSEVRMAVADAGKVPTVRISFVKLLEELRWVWWLSTRMADTLSSEQEQQIMAALHESLRDQLTEGRRGRSLERALRQPVSSWPRKLKNRSWKGDAKYHLLSTHTVLSLTALRLEYPFHLQNDQRARLPAS